MKECTVIMGSGAAAYECVLAMHEEGYTGDIHVFSDTDRAPYNPMLTTYYACKKLPYSGMFPYGDDVHVWATLGAIFHPCDPVVNLDAVEKNITTASGLTLSFDKCLIATGASPILPPLKGLDSKKVYVVRTVEDAQRLYEAAQAKPKRVVVVGASMVGVKVVELFHKVGAEVCLADMAPYIFALAAHEDCAKEIMRRMEQQGIRFRFGAGLTGIVETPEGVSVEFGADAPTEQGDLVVMCIGVRGNTAPLNREELAMDRGVLVDCHMATNISGIYAAGDVAQGMELLSGTQQIIGLWANARMQGRTAGLNMAGIPTEYQGNILHNITHFMGMDFVGLGQVKGYDRMESIHTDTGLTMRFWLDGRLVGANFLDRYLACGVLRAALVIAPVVAGMLPHGAYHGEHPRILEELLTGI